MTPTPDQIRDMFPEGETDDKTRQSILRLALLLEIGESLTRTAGHKPYGMGGNPVHPTRKEKENEAD